MLVSYLWLKQLVDFDESPKETSATLTGLGLECAVIEDRSDWYNNIVIGKITHVEPHPNADKLRLCEVDIGGGIQDIVCGAPNVAEGQTVAVALEGAVLPDGTKIIKRKIRGRLSDGMIPSEAELGISDDHDGIMELDGDCVIGEKFASAYEVCDTILEIDMTPNRGDCLSMIGVAREVCAVTGGTLRLPPVDLREDESEACADILTVQIDADDLCLRYTGRVVKGLRIARSPFWMRRRLSALGIRSINNVVDITNYVLMETGHPLHAFDRAMIAGGKIIVRKAFDKGEEFVTLDGKTHKLPEGALLIADNDRAIALAGIMGGMNSEVTRDTKDVIIESAYFTPQSIRRTSKALGISSESSFRFERGADIHGLIYAQDRAAHLLEKLCGGAALKGKVDVYPEHLAPIKVTVRKSRAEKILGLALPDGKIEQILGGLQMSPTMADSDTFSVTVPFFRHDIEREIDLIEEIGRLNGYDNTPSLLPEVLASEPTENNLYDTRGKVRKILTSAGFMEGMRNSFTSLADMDKLNLPDRHPFRKLVSIDNPLSSEWTHLRSTLIPGLLAPLAGAGDACVYEIGVVFESRAEQAPLEKWVVSAVMTQTVAPNIWRGRSGERDFFDIKGVVIELVDRLGLGQTMFKPSAHPYLYPKRQADLFIADKLIGHLGQTHPAVLESYDAGQEIFLFELDLNMVSGIIPSKPAYKQIGRFPSVKRDLAVVIDDRIANLDLLDSIHKSANIGDIECSARLFDLYRDEKIGRGKKSVAYSLEFRAVSRTLTDDEADTLLESILVRLGVDCGAKLR